MTCHCRSPISLHLSCNTVVCSPAQSRAHASVSHGRAAFAPGPALLCHLPTCARASASSTAGVGSAEVLRDTRGGEGGGRGSSGEAWNGGPDLRPVVRRRCLREGGAAGGVGPTPSQTNCHVISMHYEAATNMCALTPGRATACGCVWGGVAPVPFLRKGRGQGLRDEGASGRGLIAVPRAAGARHWMALLSGAICAAAPFAVAPLVPWGPVRTGRRPEGAERKVAE